LFAEPEMGSVRYRVHKIRRRPWPSAARVHPASVPARTPRGTRAPAMTGRRVAWPGLSSPPALTRRTPTRRPTLRLRGGVALRSSLTLPRFPVLLPGWISNRGSILNRWPTTGIVSSGLHFEALDPCRRDTHAPKGAVPRIHENEPPSRFDSSRRGKNVTTNPTGTLPVSREPTGSSHRRNPGWASPRATHGPPSRMWLPARR